MKNVTCTKCGGSGPWRECQRVVELVICRRRVQVDDKNVPGVVA